MTDVNECERCGAKILQQRHSRAREHNFVRYTGSKNHESRSIRLCSTCLDDIWEFVFNEEVDRSGKADPVPLERLSENVERHISDLEGVRDEIMGVKHDD
jgi:hypothetical protein